MKEKEEEEQVKYNKGDIMISDFFAASEPVSLAILQGRWIPEFVQVFHRIMSGRLSARREAQQKLGDAAGRWP